ncbi:MAG: radical SAM protein, partial [Thermodesulfobacteriota bacterium]
MNNFKVLLVYPNLQMVNLLPSNIAILSACLKQSGIDVRLFDTTLYQISEKSVDDIRVEHLQLRPFKLVEKGVDYKETDVFEDFQAVVNEYAPHIIAVSATDDTYDLGIDLVSQVRE